MKTTKILIFLVILLVFLSSVIWADSFKDTLKNNLNSQIRVYVKYGSGADIGFNNATLIIIGVLIDVQDDYIKLMDGKQEVFIKIDDISAYRVESRKK